MIHMLKTMLKPQPITTRAGIMPVLILVCLAAALFLGSIAPAFAQAPPPPPAPSGTCTTDAPFNPTPPPPGDGIVSKIVDNVKTVLDTLQQQMYQYIIGENGFREMTIAMVTLYIAIYGILFMFAMVQITLFDFALRMIKLGIIAMLLGGGSWGYFNDIVVTFFNDGTDQLISVLTQIAVGGISNPINPGDPPFAALDDAIQHAMSAKMAVTLLAIFFTGPYGLLFGLLLLMALGSFMRALLTAIWVYLMSLVIKTLLFGIAPLFIICILFNRTRHLFQGWLNQVINASLQPVMLFAFFAFFAKLIEAAMEKILQVPVCWTEAMESVRGTPFHTHYWRFTTESSSGSGVYEPYGGLWTWTGASTPNAPTFPIDIMDVLIFLILAELASRFNSVVLMIARDLANSTTSLATMQGSLSDWMSPVGGRKGGAPGDVGRNVTAGYGGSGSVPRGPTGGGGGGGAPSGGVPGGVGDGSVRSQAAAAAAAETTLR